MYCKIKTQYNVERQKEWTSIECIEDSFYFNYNIMRISIYSVLWKITTLYNTIYTPQALWRTTEYCKIRQSFELENSKGVIDDYYEIFYRSIWLRAV